MTNQTQHAAWIEALETENGKYKFIFDKGKFTCLRNGEPWQDFTGDKAVLSLFQELKSLRDSLGNGEPVAWMNKSGSTMAPRARLHLLEQEKYGGEFAAAARMAADHNIPLYLASPPAPAQQKIPDFDKEWCEKMAKMEGNASIQVGGETTPKNYSESDAWADLSITALKELWLMLDAKSQAEAVNKIQKLLETPEQQASVPDGWQCVPKEATPAMFEACADHWPTGGRITLAMNTAWKAMLAAAQRPAVTDDVARAVAAERERCAELCEQWNTTPGGRLAAEIRKGGEA